VRAGFGEVHALQHRALFPAVVVAGDQHGRARDARQRFVDEIDDGAVDAVVVEEIAGDEEEIGIRLDDDVDDVRERVPRVSAFVAVAEVDVGGMGDA
jgi:hypothetical protein